MASRQRYLSDEMVSDVRPNHQLRSSGAVAYLGGGACARPDRRDFCNYFGIIFSAV